ncbi:MAG: DNA-3-methyladenine glycosylase [Steroidobacter sp.]
MNVLKLPRNFYEQPTLKVARELLGKYLVRIDNGTQRVGRIVETEAYQGPQDLAAHSARGRTERNQVMFGTAGHLYVYLIYGMWNCMNVVTRETGVPHAVLIRAVEPIENLGDKTHGPGLSCKAYNIDRRLNGTDLCGDIMWIEKRGNKPVKIQRAARVGIDYAGDWAHKLWRFYDRDSAYVSTLTAAQRKRLKMVQGISV